MGIDFYTMDLSPPCRSVLLLAKAINVPLNIKTTNLFTGEHMTPEFIKINPRHCIPTMVDDGFVLSESRSILACLANKYAPGSAIYPTDPKKRGVIDQMMYFDMGSLYLRFQEAYYPLLFAGQKEYVEDKLTRFDEALKWLDDILATNTYGCGNEMTIADFTLMSSLATMELVAEKHDMKKYPNILRYMDRCRKEMKGYAELNQKGAQEFGDYAKKTLPK